MFSFFCFILCKIIKNKYYKYHKAYNFKKFDNILEIITKYNYDFQNHFNDNFQKKNLNRINHI
jgi:hypothetical protein